MATMIPQRLPRIGEIRTGDEKGTGEGGRGAKLDHFRITSDDAEICEELCAAYGTADSKVTDWQATNFKGQPVGEPKFQCHIGRKLRVLIPAAAQRPIFQGYQAWGSGGLKRRCVGPGGMAYVAGVEQPCLCQELDAADERADWCHPSGSISFLVDGVSYGLFTHHFSSATFNGRPHAFGSVLAPIRAILELNPSAMIPGHYTLKNYKRQIPIHDRTTGEVTQRNVEYWAPEFRPTAKVNISALMGDSIPQLQATSPTEGPKLTEGEITGEVEVEPPNETEAPAEQILETATNGGDEIDELLKSATGIDEFLELLELASNSRELSAVALAGTKALTKAPEKARLIAEFNDQKTRVG